MKIRYTDERAFTEDQVEELFLSVDWVSGKYPERLYKALQSCETVFTAWDGERLVGLANAIDDDGMTAYVHYLLVQPDYQGAGIGRDLIEMMKRRYEDFPYLFLVAENPPLVGYYEGLDFKKLGESSVMAISKK
ncbi:MAG: GNAT family N-acetyltransferase [Oscillospiraceae bacterium]|nr:GNAT family N-acetyltransferase [Oscillospiraceae bacterium]